MELLREQSFCTPPKESSLLGGVEGPRGRILGAGELVGWWESLVGWWESLLGWWESLVGWLESLVPFWSGEFWPGDEPVL